MERIALGSFHFDLHDLAPLTLREFYEPTDEVIARPTEPAGAVGLERELEEGAGVHSGDLHASLEKPFAHRSGLRVSVYCIAWVVGVGEADGDDDQENSGRGCRENYTRIFRICTVFTVSTRQRRVRGV